MADKYTSMKQIREKYLPKDKNEYAELSNYEKIGIILSESALEKVKVKLNP